MISDETFPVEHDSEEQYSVATNGGDTYASTETLETSMYSSQNCTSSTDNSYPGKSFANETTAPSQSDEAELLLDSHFVSFDTSERQLALLPPRAPIKKKKYSQSCHELSKKNYGHVESKVKKFIENMNESDRQRRISRHKSMPISTQPPIDDTFSQEKDAAVLIKELRKKSVKIYELQDQCDTKDQQIYSLEYERSKMKMTFDKLRSEMHDLKMIERDYKKLTMTSPPKTSLTDKSVQTDESNTKRIFVSWINDQHPAVRELTYSESNVANLSLNHTHFSDLNNASSDNLIPFSEISLEDVSNPRIVEREVEEATEDEPKKTKKIRRFFKMMSCVSKK